MDTERIGELWQGWKTVGKIGSGSFGTVYEIERDFFGEIEKAALKVITIPQDNSDIEELRSLGYSDEGIVQHYRSCFEDIAREYMLMAKLKGQSNIVDCDDLRYIPHDDGFGWDILIKMELLTPMLKVLDCFTDEAKIVQLGVDLSRALLLCRNRNIIHRDIKPQNIFLSADGDFKLGDFGIAKTAERTAGGTKTGTYNYMAPEVYNNQPYGATADIYSLGLVLYWLLNERRMPFVPLPPQMPTPHLDEQARFRRFRGEPLPPPAHGSKKLQQVVLKACAFSPSERYSSAEEMLAALMTLSSKGKVSTIAPMHTKDGPTVMLYQQRIPVETVQTQGPSTGPIPVQPLATEPLSTQSACAEASYAPSATAEKPKHSKKWRWILLLLALLLVVGVFVVCNLTSEEDEKPKTETTTQAPSTEQTLQTEESTSESAPESTASEPVADVMGKAKDEAVAILEALHFTVTVEESFHSEVPEGLVISQSPEAGILHNVGEAVVIYVSKGKQTVDVTLDACGGSISQSTLTVDCGGPYGGLPTPTKRGQNFIGWFTAPKGGERVTESTVVTESTAHTLYALWSDVVYTLDLNANGGRVSPTSLSVAHGSAYGTLPTPVREHYRFEGWFTTAQGGSKIASSTIAEANATVYARWTPVNYTLSLSANGGTVSQTSLSLPYGASYGTLPTPTRQHYRFDGWYTAAQGGSKVTASTSVMGNTTIYARWTPNNYTLTLNANGGSVSQSSFTLAYGASYGTLPTPTRAYYSFNGWYTAAQGGSKVSSATTIGANTTLYAQWTQKGVSEWVLASSVPAGAQIVEQKWTYNKTSYAQSSESSMAGYTLYNTTTAWSDYGAWSAWSSTAVGASDSRQVETRTVTDVAGYTQYRYWRYRKSGDTKIHWCNYLGAQYHGGSWYQEYTDWSNSAKSLYKSSYGRCSCHGTVNAYGPSNNLYYWQETRWIAPVTHTEYRYRDRTLIYTYYFSKTESLESATEVSASDSVTNVQHWVKYRAK